MEIKVSKLIGLFQGVDVSQPTEPFGYDIETPTLYTEKLSYILIAMIARLANEGYAVEGLTVKDESRDEGGQTKQSIIDRIMGMFPAVIPEAYTPVVNMILPALIGEAVELALQPESIVRDIAVNAIDKVIMFAFSVLRDIIYENYIKDNPGEQPPNPEQGDCCEDMIEKLDGIREAIYGAKTLQKAISYKNIKIADDGSWVDILQEE
jgi:hypothetical protein